MKILLIGTGGTLLSVESSEGLKPSLNLKVIFDYLPNQIYKNHKINIISAFNIDSSNIDCFHILTLANIIYEKYKDYDGFLIIHGTDTMAYTSATLYYMFENLKKPIVLTGSQFPIQAEDSDAKKNIIDSIRFIQEEKAGVFVVFGGKVIFGERAYKKRSRSPNAFVSLNVPCFAQIQKDKIQYNQVLSQQNEKSLIFRNKLEKKVLLIKLYPNLSKTTFREITKEYQAIIVEGFGVGNVPKDVAEIMRDLLEQNKLVILTTQCLLEGVVPNQYATGHIHKDVLYLSDLHSEAILAKCRIALGCYQTKEEIRKYLLSK